MLFEELPHLNKTIRYIIEPSTKIREGSLLLFFIPYIFAAIVKHVYRDVNINNLIKIK